MRVEIAGLGQGEYDVFSPADGQNQTLQKNMPETPACGYKVVLILIPII